MVMSCRIRVASLLVLLVEAVTPSRMLAEESARDPTAAITAFQLMFGWGKKGTREQLVRAVQRAVALLVLAVGPLSIAPLASAADLEADAWPEFDIWISLDEEQKDRIYILNSYADEANFQYQETALGVSWDRRFHPNWSSGASALATSGSRSIHQTRTKEDIRHRREPCYLQAG